MALLRKGRLLALVTLTCLSFPALAQDSVPVTVAKPARSDIAQTLRLSGSLTAEHRASLSPRVDGLVTELLVDTGSRVTEGDLLLRLDPTLAQLELARTRAAKQEAIARRDEARRLLDEALRLREKQHISASEVAERQANLALAEAALSAAEAERAVAAEILARHDLPAPFTGVISARHTDAGEWVGRGDTVLELVALEPVRMEVMVPQEQFSAVNSQTSVSIIPDSAPALTLDGRITARVPVSDSAARAFLVRIIVEKPETVLLPGTSATAVFQLPGSDGAQLTVPRDSLLRQPDGGYSLFVVEDGTARRVPVTIGASGPEGVAVLQGIGANDQVVIRGNEVLRDGQPVRITSPSNIP